MVWKSSITTNEANKLIEILSENVGRELLSGRMEVGSQLFPVSTYICVACYQLYDQTYQYNIVKKMVDNGCDPREIGPKCKTICAILNGLAFQSFAMLYLHGRAEAIYDWGGADKEPEEKREETKYILDFFRHLNPNYRNDKKLLVDQSEDHNLRVMDKSLVEKLREQMWEPTREQVKIFKKNIAIITTRNFLDMCECRAGIFEHGPYYLDSGEVLLFKDFQFLYSGEEIYAGRKAAYEHSETEAKSPVSNLSIGYILKDMKKLEFNDWGTLFADPTEFSDNITALGFWHRELLHPLEQKYPNKLGEIYPLSWETYLNVGKYAQAAMNEMYMKFADFDYMKRCILGVMLYSGFLSFFTAFAGLESEFDWDVPQQTYEYIPKFRKYPTGAHPFMGRFLRRKSKRREDPSYYYIIE